MLSVVTSYDRACEILLSLQVIALEFDLVLFDTETDNCFFNTFIDDDKITMKQREQTLRRRIEEENQPLWSILTLASYKMEWLQYTDIAVTLQKVADVPLKERVRRFYQTLCNALVPGEKLVCENKSFSVKGPGYSLTFCLEAYKKQPNYCGYYVNGQPETALLHRMGCVQAKKLARQYNDREKKNIQDRMHLREMYVRHENPGDRFVRSVNITKALQKIPFDVRFGIDCGGSTIDFSVEPDPYLSNEDWISMLAIDETDATFLLPFIKDIYPYIYDRYYDINHLPGEMWSELLDHLREARDMILHDTFNPRLKPYIQEFNLFCLVPDSYHGMDYMERVDYVRNKEQQVLYEFRYEVAHLFDIFLKWSELQLSGHAYSPGLMLCIQGP